MFPEAHKHVLTSLVLSKTQKYSLDCQRGVKKEKNIHIQEDWIREVCKRVVGFIMTDHRLILTCFLYVFCVFWPQTTSKSVASNMVCWYKATCLYVISYLILHILQCLVSNLCGLSCGISNWSFVWILPDMVYQCTTSPLSEISSDFLT